MEDVKTYEERKTMVMEGMYKGVTGKLEEVRQSVSKELQFSSAQNASAYESLAGTFKQGVDSLLAELRYLSQQNSAIYDYNQKERTDAKDALLEAVRACTEQIAALEARVNEKIDAVKAELSEKVSEEIAALNVPAAPAEVAPAEEAKAEPAEEKTAEPVTDENFDYDVLAEKIASVMPEVDYDLLVDKVVAAIPPTDADAVAAAVVATIPQVDENAIADRVAESVPLVDYDLVAERVASVMENEFDVTVDDNGIEKIAAAVAAEIDYEKLAARVAELLKEQGAFAVVAAPAAEETPAEAPAEAAEPEAEPVPAEAAPEEAPVEEVAEPAPAEEELAVSAAPAQEPKPAYTPVVVPVPDDPALTTRFKRSFKAKIIESTEEIKNYYFDLKNTFLSYARVSSQLSWSNDRFTYAGDTIAKIGVRGKTLCLYVALNPDEFPSSVYHQKFAGDTKMYEKTPMMIKIKSGVAVKRGVRLIEMLMENLGAVKEEGFTPVDYADEFAFRSEEQLLAEGLIKTAIVEKSDLDF